MAGDPTAQKAPPKTVPRVPAPAQADVGTWLWTSLAACAYLSIRTCRGNAHTLHALDEVLRLVLLWLILALGVLGGVVGVCRAAQSLVTRVFPRLPPQSAHAAVFILPVVAGVWTERRLYPLYFSSVPWAADYTRISLLYGLKVFSLLVVAVLLGLALARLHSWLAARRVRTQALGWAAAMAITIWLSWISLAPKPQPASEPLVCEPSDTRVLVVGWDGATWTVADPLLEEGRLPTLAGLVASGVRAELDTLTDSISPAVWNSIATGRSLPVHGISAFVEHFLPLGLPPLQLPHHALHTRLANRLCRHGLVARQAVSSARVPVPTLWQLVGQAQGERRTVGLFNFFNTTPVQAVPGFMFSREFFPHYRQESRRGTTMPLQDLSRDLYWDEDVAGCPEPASACAAAFAHAEQYRGPLRDDENLQGLDEDRFYAMLAPQVLSAFFPDLVLLTFYASDPVGHYCWPCWQPETHPHIAARECDRYGATLPDYYAQLDEYLGQLLRHVDMDRTTVLLISDHGMEPVIGAPEYQRAAHDNHTPGILVMAGRHVRAGVTLERAHILDLLPTVLYLLGMPLSRELEGRVLAEALDPALSQHRPARWVPCYGPARWISPSGPEVGPSKEFIERMEKIGYFE